MTSLRRRKIYRNRCNYYYGKRRRYYRLRVGRSSRAFRTAMYQYRRFRGTWYFELKTLSTGTDTKPYALFDMTNYNNSGATFSIENLLTGLGDFSAIGGYYTQYKIRGVKVQSSPGNNNFHRNQSEDPLVMVGLQNVNATAQEDRPDFGAAVQSNNMLVCNPFQVVTKYIPVHMDWLNTFTPFNVRIACTQNKNAALNYAPNFYVRFDFYVTFRGNTHGKQLKVDAAQSLGHA